VPPRIPATPILALALFAAAAVAQLPTPKLRPIPASDVRLLESPFKTAQDAHHRYLLALDADRLLARFRKEAGLAPKADGYGGWEGDTISGHSLGHYLSGLAKMFAAIGDPQLKQRAAYVVAELAACQAKHGDGYVAAIPGGRKVFDEIRRGDVRSQGFDLNGLWVPWYVLHKQLAGLLDVHRLCGDAAARDVAVKLADFCAGVVLGLDEETTRRMLRCEHGGMNEAAADVFALTGDPRHRDLARKFDDWVVLGPLAEGRDVLPGLHSNTQVPKVVGAARQWDLGSADPRHRDAALNYWTYMVGGHTYANGGNSENEYLGPAGKLSGRLEGNTSETCNTYNLLKLTGLVHAWSGDAAHMEYAERALWNHVLASQSPESAAVLYYTPFRAGSRKPWQRPFEDFTCCVGSGFENHASYGALLYFTEVANPLRPEEPPVVRVEQFVASEARLAALGATLRQESRLPDDGLVRIKVGVAAPVRFALKVRRPAWAQGAVAVTLNGAAMSASSDASYWTFDRTWKDGDDLTIDLPLALRVEPTPDDADRVAFFRGPVLMAGDCGAEPPSPGETPHLVVDDLAPARDFHLLASAPATYRSAGVVRPRDLALKPFFRVRDESYVVYWRRLTREGWTKRETEIREEAERRRALDAATVDFVQPGEMQPERDHAFEGERTNHGEHMGFRWRDAHRGGRFSFLMKSPDGAAAKLVCTYWGGDTGEREFDILVDGVKIASQMLDRNAPGRFFDVAYDLPPELTKGKPSVRVTFQAHARKTAGGVFGVRILRN
jgi:DUF1680 family protein